MFDEESKRVGTFLLAGAVIMSVLVVLSTGDYQGGDTYQHFMIAKWAFQHPYLFLDHWGKPFFTAAVAPAAQIGYWAVKLQNVLFGFISAWHAFKIARHLGHKLAWPAAFMTLCAPIFFVHLNSAMTEILFSTVITVSIYWIMKERWWSGAILLSFLPFVRTEGFVLIPFISLWFLLNKKWLPFIMLGFGTVVYSVLGYFFYFHDIMWVFHRNPYEVNVDFYGSGNWHHFISTNYVTWGVPMFISLCAGFYWILRAWKRHTGRLEIGLRKELWLVVLPSIVFLLFHGLAWWLGKLASVGEIRVLASLMPLYAVMACRGFNWLNKLFEEKSKRHSMRFITLYSVLILVMPFLFFPLPMPRRKSQIVMNEVHKWLEERNPINGRVWYFDPQIAFQGNHDPFIQGNVRPYFENDSLPAQRMRSGDLMIWDAHFADNEGRTSSDLLSDTTQFSLLRVFKPERPFNTFDGNDYVVKIFQRK